LERVEGIIKELTKDFSSIQIKWIQEKQLRNRLQFNWINMKLDNNGDWNLDLNGKLK
jgi:hypothetical protein